MARRRRRKKHFLKKALPRSRFARLVLLVAGLGVGALGAVNLSVAFFGETLVNPLSPFFLSQKVDALGRYLRHRPSCLLSGHGDIAHIVRATAARHDLDPHLLAALVEVESGSRPHRISRTGAMGAAQLMPGTADLLRVSDAFDPEAGIDGGARYLKSMLKRFGGDSRLALAAYNAGPGSVRGGRVPQNGETEFYVVRVLRRWNELQPAGAR